MKKILALILALVMALSLVACGEKAPVDEGNNEPEYKVAMVTDYGDITDQSFNQTTYEACKAFADANGVKFTYYKPAGDSDAERVAMIEKAVDEGYNVIVLPGFAFANAIAQSAPNYADVKFIALDVAEFDLTSAGLTADTMKNVYSAVYQKSCPVTWPVTLLSSWVTPSWASWVVWLFPPCSASATATCRASMLLLRSWASLLT